uniref:Uncharacterized protein n=2 Tax=Arion vulgaris TaxID=1028688 RepID=A0A0B7ACL0_9EUPU
MSCGSGGPPSWTAAGSHSSSYLQVRHSSREVVLYTGGYPSCSVTCCFPGVMENIHVDPRKQELLEARFLGGRDAVQSFGRVVQIKLDVTCCLCLHVSSSHWWCHSHHRNSNRTAAILAAAAQETETMVKVLCQHQTKVNQMIENEREKLIIHLPQRE